MVQCRAECIYRLSFLEALVPAALHPAECVGGQLAKSHQKVSYFPFTAGGALNPARALGPSIVFVCRWSTTWVYVLAEFAGGILAGLFSFPLYGRGMFSLFSVAVLDAH